MRISNKPKYNESEMKQKKNNNQPTMENKWFLKRWSQTHTETETQREGEIEKGMECLKKE